MTTSDGPPGAPAAEASLHPRLAAALVFFASGAVLVIEVVALRLVAPYVGVQAGNLFLQCLYFRSQSKLLRVHDALQRREHLSAQGRKLIFKID